MIIITVIIVIGYDKYKTEKRGGLYVQYLCLEGKRIEDNHNGVILREDDNNYNLCKSYPNTDGWMVRTTRYLPSLSPWGGMDVVPFLFWLLLLLLLLAFLSKLFSLSLISVAEEAAAFLFRIPLWETSRVLSPIGWWNSRRSSKSSESNIQKQLLLIDGEGSSYGIKQIINYLIRSIILG